MPEFIDIGRPEGCRAQFSDDGLSQQAPVCLGGTELMGCHNYQECENVFRGRVGGGNPPVTYKITNDGQRVTDISLTRG